MAQQSPRPSSAVPVKANQQIINRGNDDAAIGNDVRPQPAQHNGTGPPQSSTSTSTSTPGPAPTKPVFKMKRTGFSGPFPGVSISAGTGTGTVLNSASSSTPRNNPSAGPGSGSSPAPGSRVGTNQVSQSSPFLPVSAGLSSTANKDDKRTEKSTRENASRQPSNPQPAQSQPTSTGLDRSHPIEIVESDVEMADSSTSLPTPPVVEVSKPWGESRNVTHPDALDDREYKSWIDENGQVTSTFGAFLPPGYKKADSTAFPWICPVRTCRKMLPSLAGLGKHFCNSHRAAKFNDNLDGTLSDIGTWTDPTRGDGRMQRGSAKPPIIVSKIARGLDESPMVEPTLHQRAGGGPTRASLPAKGGPRQRSQPERRKSARQASSAPDDDFEDSENDTTSDASLDLKLKKSSQPYGAMSLEFANPDRRYDMWPGKDGTLRKAFGALIPDSYEMDRTLSDRPWICPIRSCRRLFRADYELGHHFKSIHKGCILNDNLDGTLSILTQHKASSSSSSAHNPPIIISRNPVDSEPMLEPQRPTYRTPTNVAWISVYSNEAQALGQDGGAKPNAAVKSLQQTKGSEAKPNVNQNDDRSAYDMATANRRYSDWIDETGYLIRMSGALIPEGYKLDDTFLERPWICPIRTCRITCKKRRGLDNHFSNSHAHQTLNDNGDGTFSIVSSHAGREPKVVSKDPLPPDAPPIAEAKVPEALATKWNLDEEKQKAIKAREEEQKRVSAAVSDPRALWQYISRFIGDEPPPQNGAIRYLLSLPRVRDLRLISPLSAEMDLRQIAALIIQVTGKEHDRQCTTCRRHAAGPFENCVNNVSNDNTDLRQLLGSYVRSCSNCLYQKLGNQCSVKAYISAGVPGVKATKLLSGSTTPQVAPDTIEEDEDDDYPQPAHRSLRRRTNIFPPSFDTDDNGDSFYPNQYASTAGRPNSERLTPSETSSEQRSKLVTLKYPDGALKRRNLADLNSRDKRPRLDDQSSTIPDPQAPNLLPDRVQTSGEDIVMEDWERGDGLVSSESATARSGPTGNMAFSASHLLSSAHPNRTIQVTKNVSFLAVNIASGTAHRFEADAKKTRICSLTSGKVRVRIDGEKEFAIGAHGMFRLVLGRGGVVLNRGYGDAVLHVTIVAV